MATRIVEGKKPYTGGKAITIDENKVISLNLRDENNLIIYDAGDDEIYVDLQLDDEITPTSAFPIGVNVGRVIVDNGWDKPGTIISAETTSGDNIKIFYADEGTLWIDNGTGTFKQIYFKADVDALLLALRNYIDGELAKKQNGVSSDTAPSNPSEGDLWYDTTNSAMKVWDGTAWQSVGTGGGGSDIVYATQAEYNALLPGALTDNKHYFIYTESGGGGGWQPGANTVAYYPLTSSTQGNDMSGNGYNMTLHNNPTFGTSYGVDCMKSYGSDGVGGGNGLYTTSLSTSSLGNSFSIGCWALLETSSFIGVISETSTPSWNGLGIVLENASVTSERLLNNTINRIKYSGTITKKVWHYILTTYDNGAGNIYYDGQQVATGNYNIGSAPYIAIGVYFSQGTSTGSNYACNGYISNVILENKVRTAQEVAYYYDQTKGDYGIS